MILAPLLPRRQPEDDHTPVDPRALCRAYLLSALAIAFGTWLLCCCTGCAFTLADINVGASAGTAFDDPFNWGKRTYQVNISGHYTRDRRP